MSIHADKMQETKIQSVANEVSRKHYDGETRFQFVDKRPDAIVQRKLQEMGNNSVKMKQLRAFQEMSNNSPQTKQAAQLQNMADNYSAQQLQPFQKKANPEPGRRENKTGLPDNLKSGIEILSGYSIDDVKVHYNSDKPAQLQAHAYAQGIDIHLGPGQEKHLPHEAWHIVQQKQGRVKPTTQMKGKVNVNDDVGLEKEADAMGKLALTEKSLDECNNYMFTLKMKEVTSDPSYVIQPKWDVITFSDGVPNSTTIDVLPDLINFYGIKPTEIPKDDKILDRYHISIVQQQGSELYSLTFKNEAELYTVNRLDKGGLVKQIDRIIIRYNQEPNVLTNDKLGFDSVSLDAGQFFNDQGLGPGLSVHHSVKNSVGLKVGSGRIEERIWKLEDDHVYTLPKNFAEGSFDDFHFIPHGVKIKYNSLHTIQYWFENNETSPITNSGFAITREFKVLSDNEKPIYEVTITKSPMYVSIKSTKGNIGRGKEVKVVFKMKDQEGKWTIV